MQNLGELNSVGGFFEKTNTGQFIFLGRSHSGALAAAILSVNNGKAVVEYSENISCKSIVSFVSALKCDHSTGKILFCYCYHESSIRYANTIKPDYLGGFTLGDELNVNNVADLDQRSSKTYLFFSSQLSKLFVCNAISSSPYCIRLMVVDTSGDLISISAVSEIGEKQHIYNPVFFFDDISGRYVFFWGTKYPYQRYYCLADYADGKFVFDSPVMYDSSGRGESVVVYSKAISSAVVFDRYKEDIKSGYSRVIRPAGSNAKDYIGLARRDALVGSDASVAVEGDIVDGFSGLSIKSEYWLAPGGGIQPYNTGLSKVGIAVSDTSILIRR
ncbi:hypothetical protein [Oceanospirillum sediminis]|uniref:Uncharacterized protein n=1 Tax=Oceanospirillum sediminis TaxID=2760088 RepID=A0A839IN36_9GAMM|nr:hypothetical protein [Oceanospirillum sediminis]MBB1485887.1 hypothetical protein [Oceanospirillum sediminis]